MRGPRMHGSGSTSLLVPLVALVLLLPLGVPPAASAATDCTSPPAVFPIDELKPGMTATGLTTISGTTPTPFTVEVLGVEPNGILVDLDLVVVRITGPASFIDRTGGVFAGMSGSPVSIDGKLVGAVSYWVSNDPTIFGLTPAQPMVNMLAWSTSSAGRPASRIALDDRTRRTIAAALDVPVAEAPTGLQQLPTTLGVSGLTGGTLDRFRRKVERRFPSLGVTTAGGMEPGLPVDTTPLSPGQPVGSVLSWGDFTIWAAGTVTLTCQDEMAAYGHTLFWDPPGDVEIGMTGVNVLAVGASDVWGGNMVPVLTQPRGTFVQDRFMGSVGVMGREPASMPITTEFASPDTGISRTGETDAIMQANWNGDWALWGHLVQNLAAVQQEVAPGTLGYDYTLTGTREDGSEFTVRNRGMFYSDYGAVYEVYKLENAYDMIAYGGWPGVEVTSIHAEGSITSARLEGTIAQIRTSSSLQPRLASRGELRARPGSRIRVEVTLNPVEGGEPAVATLTMRVPRSARGDIYVSLRGGRDRGYVRGASSFEELLRALNGGQHQNDLIVRGLGRTVVQQQPVIVTGKGGFEVHVVR
jgi:SpoIVB peptidase S55